MNQARPGNSSYYLSLCIVLRGPFLYLSFFLKYFTDFFSDMMLTEAQIEHTLVLYLSYGEAVRQMRRKTVSTLEPISHNATRYYLSFFSSTLFKLCETSILLKCVSRPSRTDPNDIPMISSGFLTEDPYRVPSLQMTKMSSLTRRK